MKIAVLATEYLHDYLEDSIPRLDLDCEIEIFIYYNYRHIVELYRQLENRFDGFITTGPVPMQTIRKSVPDCKPLSFFLCSDSNYYKMFFEVIYKYQDWNFEYGYFDFCDYLCPDQESSLIEHLKNGTLKDWIDRNNRYMATMSLEDMVKSTQRKLEKHIRLWNSGKIKYSLSRMSPIMPQLLEAGVNCHYISFNLDDIKICFKQLTQEILVNQLRENQPAAIDIRLPAPESTEPGSTSEFQLQYEPVEKLIRAFSKKQLCDFILRKTHLGFRIATSRKTIEAITDRFTACKLKQYLSAGCGFDVYIGYGLGEDLTQAEVAAMDASREAKMNSAGISYLIDEKQNRISLSGEGNDVAVQSGVSPYIREISELTGLSILTIQRLAAALQVTGTQEVTTQELSRILHITTRSANRFTASLVKCNLARVLYAKQTNTKGRPSKVYHFLLDLDRLT